MRLLSLAARGGMLDRALEDMRKVTSDKAAIQYGYIVKEDGTRRPRWHDSEVSLLAYAIQEIIKDYALVVDDPQEEAVPAEEPLQPQIIPGKKCNECGAHAVVKRDGCEICTSCGAIGSCG
jgi:ribonucleoside-diphosphate reductase alpha chain